MPVFEQGYRSFEGELARRSPIPAATWQNIRTRMRWWIWLLTAGLLLYPYVVWGVLIFVLTAGQALFGGAPPAGMATVPEVAYGASGDPNPARLMAMIGASTPRGALALYWTIMQQASLAAIVLPAVACGGILASDRATGAMQIYFARPVTRFQYLLTKILAVAFFTSLVTAAPTLFIWAETVAFHPEAEFVFRTWMAPFSIVGASFFYALWSSAVVLTLSSLMRRPVLASICAIFGYFLLQYVSYLITTGLDDLSWRLIDPRYALGGMVAPLFGLELPDWLATPWLPVPSLIVPLALLFWVWKRIRAVEVTT
jgi:ABC-type transport system involved in multi-copper enzyme maturation permease subunit